MSGTRKYNIRKIISTVMWSIAGCCSLFLLIAAVKKNDQNVCNGVIISISGVTNHFFLDKNDVKAMLFRAEGRTYGKAINRFQLKKLEKLLKSNIWIRNAELYFDNNRILQIEIDEREPVARIFTKTGNSFYIDSTLMILPLSDKFSARLPVFTGYPADSKVLSKGDSALLKQVFYISQSIQSDQFLMGMIDQVDITDTRTFEMIPKIGDQVILFGDGNDVNEKFRKLKLFYKNVIVNKGWNHYSIINLEYKSQVVGKIRDAADVTSDSLRTVQLLQLIAVNTARLASDSSVHVKEQILSDSTIIERSVQRDEGASADVRDTIIKQPILQTTVMPEPVIKAKTLRSENLDRPATMKQPAKETKPKAVMGEAAKNNQKENN